MCSSVSLSPPPESPCSHRTSWNFFKADFQSLYASFADLNWDDVISTNCVNSAVGLFYRKIYESVDKFVPRKKYISMKSKYSYPPWFTNEIIRNIKNKYFHHKRYKRDNKEFNLVMFRYYRTLVKELVDLSYDSYMRKVELDMTKDPKSFWCYVKDQRKERHECDEFRYRGESVAGQNAADAFARYFSSVFLDDVPSLDINKAQLPISALPSAHITVQNICAKELLGAIKRLKPRSATGPDGIPPYLVKDCARIFISPLLHLFNLSVDTGKYPDCWKVSRVTPVHKGGDKAEVSNYRPIAVLSVFGKLYETILNARLGQQIDIYLDNSQHGFRSGRSTITNHVNFVDYVTAKMDAGLQVDAAYFDFQKAFDRVDNDILLQKCSSIGFNPKLLSLFASYLQNRSQYVQLPGSKLHSNDFYTRSGVSQGSTLGPTQFLIMVNDLPKAVSTSECLMFADDLKLFLAVGNTADCEALQHDIDSVSAWSARNRLHFNASKCKMITFTRKHTPLTYDYRLTDDTTIERVDQIRDLGLTLDTEINFRDHVTDICKQAYRMLGFIMRTSYNFKDARAPMALYTAYVRSKLEYDAAVWDPHEKKYSLMVERIQRKFARYLYKKMYGFYPYMYPSLFVSGMVGLYTLELRRKMQLIMHYYLLLHNKVNNPSVVSELRLLVPNEYMRGCDPERGPRRIRRLLQPPPGLHSVRAYNAPTSRFILLMNDILTQQPDLDIFFDKMGRFSNKLLAHLSCSM